MHLVGCHRFAVARTPEYNPTFANAVRDSFRRRPDEKRIIDRFLVEGAEVFHLMSECAEQLFHFLFVMETGVIRSEGNFHSTSLLDHRVERCPEQDLELNPRAIWPIRSRFPAPARLVFSAHSFARPRKGPHVCQKFRVDPVHANGSVVRPAFLAEPSGGHFSRALAPSVLFQALLAMARSSPRESNRFLQL